ncbi:MAG: DUF1583 domain-containing protein [Planctomycetaceae bacterium]|nr:DUF1583 domain-containing protein [Planctomycetaceae bacterium]
MTTGNTARKMARPGLTVVLGTWLLVSSAFAAPTDGQALTAIFGDDVIASNVAVIRATASRMNAADRYEWLAGSLLPSPTHESIRFAGDFEREGVVSPILDLVTTAKELDRLEELRQRVLDRKAVGEVNARRQLALLGLIAMEQGDLSDAAKRLRDMSHRLADETFAELSSRWPETLLLKAAVEHEELRDLADEVLERILAQQIRVPHHSGPLEWDQQIAGIRGRSRYLRIVGAQTAPQPFPSAPPLRQWQSVAHSSAETLGKGFPAMHWHLDGRTVHKLASHFDTFLTFGCPLTGDYQIECDISGFDYREGQLMVGGEWLWLHFSHETFDLGNINGQSRQVSMDPKLSLVNDWVHYRCTVRGGVCSHFVNGRLLHTQELGEHPFPWVAIRSPYWASTSVRDVRITGTPEIPRTLRLSDDPSLRGWRSYYDGMEADSPGWEYDPDVEPNGGIVAAKSPKAKGTAQEHLLRYFRPLFEDGVIEYEFFYEPGESLVSPTLGDQAFVLGPDGVRVHQLTNGRWDRSGLDPANFSEVVAEGACPLVSGWNRLRLETIGDTVRLRLNDRPIYEGEIAPINDRTFGLFHDLGETAVQVRNVTWTGSWPNELPSLPEQELRSTELDEVDQRVAKLSQELFYNFSTSPKLVIRGQQGVPFSDQQFLTQTNDPGAKVKVQQDGLFMSRGPSQPFTDVWVGRRLRIHGDFDVVAEFEGLELKTPQDGHALISLTVVTEDDLTTHTGIWYGVYAHPGIDRRRCAQVQFTRYYENEVALEFPALFAEASDSGRLRIVRIGEEMFYLVAEGDSPGYRLLHREKVNADPIRIDGLRLTGGTYDNVNPPQGSARVLWKSLHVKAEKIDGRPPGPIRRGEFFFFTR